MKTLKDREKDFENEIFHNSQNKLSEHLLYKIKSIQNNYLKLKIQAEISQMSSQIKAYQSHVNELESERNAMIIAHQCQISQLKESFKERMKSSDSWPEKLSFELNKEREKHNEIVKTIENELRENFGMVIT